jgi:hypothetical protein
MDVIQAKLQECVNSGQMNSFDRLSNLFAGNTQQAADGDVQMNTEGKDESKIPARKSTSAKIALKKMEGQYGDKTTRKVGERRQKERSRGRSRGPSLEGRKQRSSSKKRSGKKLAVIS